MIYVIKLFYSFLLPPGIYVLGLAVITWWALRRHKPMGVILAAFTIFFYVTSTGYFGAWLIRTLEEQYSPPQTLQGDVIIMLGGGAVAGTPDLNGSGGLSGSAANRLLTTARLQRTTGLPVILSGGQVFGDTGQEARIASRLLQDLGVPADKIVVEDQSLTTKENALYVNELMAGRGYSKPVLITSAFHMPRSVLIFNRLGMQVIPFPTDYQVSSYSGLYATNLIPYSSGVYLSALAVKEYLGIAALKAGL